MTITGHDFIAIRTAMDGHLLDDTIQMIMTVNLVLGKRVIDGVIDFIEDDITTEEEDGGGGSADHCSDFDHGASQDAG
jgi:hypothetical protein